MFERIWTVLGSTLVVDRLCGFMTDVWFTLAAMSTLRLSARGYIRLGHLQGQALQGQSR